MYAWSLKLVRFLRPIWNCTPPASSTATPVTKSAWNSHPGSSLAIAPRACAS
jgi:hypothetical protein